MNDRYLNVLLPTSDGRKNLEVYTCDRAKCDSCIVRFKCFTTGGNLDISYGEWSEIRDHLEWSGGHKILDHQVWGERLP